ncbi:MAG: hypothetical protein Q9164_003569 [Protoblastenia rupestris]
MLHELLLCLSGHPSPLLSYHSGGTKDDPGVFQSLLSPAENALLSSLSKDLGEKHRSIRENATKISSSHASTVCCAVAAAIISTHLANFQRRILEVEKDILEESSSIVGAYNIVPLSAVAGAFDGWARRLQWLWDLVQFVQEPSVRRQGANGNVRLGQDALPTCTAAETIKWLRDASHTGYPDIELMSLNLIKVAETAWLRQMSAWVLYGRHPGGSDFFVALESNIKDAKSSYHVISSLVPCFVTSSTANSILFIGKSLNHIKDRQSSVRERSYGGTAPDLSLLPMHLAHLSALQTPISSASFSAAINAIRLSLSQNALQKLLPMKKVLETLHILKDYFLLERGEFAVALITAADDRLSSRNQRGVRGSKAALKSIDDLANLTISDGEVHSVLARTWTTLASLQNVNDDETDESLEPARELITLSVKSLESGSSLPKDKPHAAGPSVPLFDDLLLPSSTILSLRVPSPLDLFLSSSDVETYSGINAYLLAIRRAHLRLSKLFLLSSLRKEHPSPKAKSQSNHKGSPNRRRNLANWRTKTMRPIWATIASAAFFFAELGEYIQGEIVQSSWNTFHEWLVPSAVPATSSNQSNLLSSSFRPDGNYISSRPSSSRQNNDVVSYDIRDPESLSQAHRRYLSALRHSVLLDDSNFATLLRRQMTAMDHMLALMQRLDAVQQSLDVEVDADGDSTIQHLAREEHQLIADLSSSRVKVSNGIEGLVASLRNIDSARAGGRDLGALQGSSQNEFVPWSGGGLERLLLKFDYGNVDRPVPSQFIDG